MRDLEFKKTGYEAYELLVRGGPGMVTSLTREEWLKAVELITAQMDAESEAVAQRWGRVAAVVLDKDPDDVSKHPRAASMLPEIVEVVNRLIALYEKGGFEVGYVQSLISPDTNANDAQTSGLTPGGSCREDTT